MTADDRELVTLTGAAGRVGKLAAPALEQRYRVRLVDLNWSGHDESSGNRLLADLRRPKAWVSALAGAHAVVHLASQPSPGISIREAIDDVAMATAHLAAAAAENGIRRVVYASSVHAMGLYPTGGRPVENSWPARPCCEYGAAKVLSENLLQIMTERTEVSAVCLRLGLTGHDPDSESHRRHWLGAGDLGRVLLGALTAEVRFGTYFAMSAGALGSYDLTDADRDLGYRPQEQPPAVRGADPPLDPDRHCRMA